jgi:hypothetical protein
MDPVQPIEEFTKHHDPAGTFNLTPVKDPKAVAA